MLQFHVADELVDDGLPADVTDMRGEEAEEPFRRLLNNAA